VTGTAAAGPGRLVLTVVGLAVRALPKGPVRRRYQRELIAELHGMSFWSQARYVLGVLCSAWALRSAVRGKALEDAVTVSPTRKRLLCLLNIKHQWWWFHKDDGEPYIACRRCGKDGPEVPPGRIAGAIAQAPYGNF
jgi:hypothetical protein